MVKAARKDSQSELTCIRVGGEWICILCDVKVNSREQMMVHEGGERHAYSLAHLKAREGDYFDFCFWRALKPYIPDYPSIFPNHQRVSRPPSIGSSVPVSPQARTPFALDPPRVSDSSFSCCSSSCSSSLDSDDLTVPKFFQVNYKRVVPRGAYYCEPCRAVSLTKTEFEEHLKKLSHTSAIEKFANVEVDYFQPVYVGTKLSFVGLVTMKGFRQDNFFDRNQSILKLQWRVADRVPTANSRIMKLSPEDFISLFNAT